MLSCRNALAITIAMAVMGVPAGALAESLRKHRSPCDITYRSDTAIKWDCRTLNPGESLESLFGDRWSDVARFNRIDRRHARAGVALKVPRQLDDVAAFTPVPLSYPAAEQAEQFVLIDLTEQFLGVYEYGALRFALPVASGNRESPTPRGLFRLTVARVQHRSSLFTVEGTDRPYPMRHALRFYISRDGISYWIHGRDLPGYPASHGCIGLYDEPMQQEEYGIPKNPELNDAKRLFEWVLGGEVSDDGMIPLPQGPVVHIIGEAPTSER